MGVFDKLRTKIGTEKTKAEDKLLSSGYSNKDDQLTAPSINVPLEASDPFLTTGLVTDDPLKDKRYTHSGLQHIEKADEGGLIQHMEHLSVAGQERDPAGLLKGARPLLSVKCGPLLRYIDTTYTSQQPVWHGSVMIVVIDGESDYSERPMLRLNIGQEVPGQVIHAQFGASFWRFDLDITLYDQPQNVIYSINHSQPNDFWVPAAHETMNMMFHSCNGFSLSVDQLKFQGPDPLWRDVLRTHQTKPFHVMLGGGDQIYCDLVSRRCALFKEWLNMATMEHKTTRPFTDDMEHELESFYFEHYSWWFRQGQFGVANGKIPMVNIFDDHDIIDGFGSYPDDFMRSPVFSGIGNVAFKYYMLFQHQSMPTDPETSNSAWVYGVNRGPYIREHSRNIVANLGPKAVFFGFDNRTERTKVQIVSRETYDKCFDRLSQQIVPGLTEHLVVLLGVPIAYPRLVWLEELLTSKAMNPLKVLGKTGVLSGFTQKFDEGVELLDDLNDHWTAKHHKQERNSFIERLQALAKSHSVRVTLLGGDVHLASVGEFYTPSPANRETVLLRRVTDHRYIPNIISSAIVNTPPAEAVSNVLSKRNKVHHLNDQCDETQFPLFEYDVTGKKLNNPCLLPRRNWCSIMQVPNMVGGGLDVRINVEIDSSNAEGRTKPYSYQIPSLDLCQHMPIGYYPQSSNGGASGAQGGHDYSAQQPAATGMNPQNYQSAPSTHNQSYTSPAQYQQPPPQHQDHTLGYQQQQQQQPTQQANYHAQAPAAYQSQPYAYQNAPYGADYGHTDMTSPAAPQVGSNYSNQTYGANYGHDAQGHAASVAPPLHNGAQDQYYQNYGPGSASGYHQ